jgi:hypothetical protein
MNKKVLVTFSVLISGMLILPVMIRADETTPPAGGMTQPAGKTPAKKMAHMKIEKKDVPAPVIAAFEKDYPSAEMVGYMKEMMEGKTVYEIQSGKKESRLEVVYNDDGSVIKTEQKIAADTLPAEITAVLKDKFAKDEIKSAEKVTKGADITYEVKLANGEKMHEVTFDPAGKVLSDKERKMGMKKAATPPMQEKK